MAESASLFQFLNPCFLHLQKMGLELKCPMCLNLLSQPILLPCNHIFCSPCSSRSPKSGSDCPVCKLPYCCQELRPAPHMENLVRIYRNMEAAFDATLLHSGSQIDLQQPEKHGTAPGENNTGEKPRKDSIHKLHRENLNEFQATTSFPSNKRVQVLPNPLENEVDTPEKAIKSSKIREVGKFVTLDGVNCVGNAGDIALVREEAYVDEEPAEFSPLSWLRDQECEEKEIEDGATNNPTKTPCSSRLFSNCKDSESESNDRGTKHSDKKSSIDRLSKKGSDDGGDLQTCSKSFSPSNPDSVNYEPEIPQEGITMTNKRASPLDKNNFRESKRQNIGSNNDIAAKNISLANSNSEIVCAFCQSPKDSEDSGPMLHYKNGRVVVADRVSMSDVLHVHKRCAEWAPNVYFVNEIAKNLEAEVVRGGKIKCSGCGQKGAALGCYAKSCRRSFHVPCAVEIPECRWDTDNFVMLCPVHSSFKFPNERSKSGKKARSICFSAAPLALEESSWDHPSLANQTKKLWSDSDGMSNKWVLCGSALSVAEKDLLAEFASLTGAIVSKAWSPNVTHVISSTDENGACRRTLKFLMAILSGRWILNMDWIKACMDSMHPVSEEPYEINRDIHGCCDGPKNGRARLVEARKLFNGLNIYFNGEFEASYKVYLQDLVLAAGGTVRQEGSRVSETCSAKGTPSTIVIYNLDLPERCTPRQESSILERRLVEAEALALELGAQFFGEGPSFKEDSFGM